MLCAGLPNLGATLLGGAPVGGAFGWIVHLGTRTAIRTKYGIPGSPTEDCLYAAFCESCAIAQEDYEIINNKGAAQMVVPVAMVAPAMVQMMQPQMVQQPMAYAAAPAPVQYAQPNAV